MTRTRRTGRLLSALAVALVGCSFQHWRPMPLAPLASSHPPSAVRVTRTSGQVVTLYGPTLRGDMLVGFDAAQETAFQPRLLVRVAVADIHAIAQRRFDPLAAFLLVGLVAVVLQSLSGDWFALPSI